jgi:hypothetical protein
MKKADVESVIKEFFPDARVDCGVFNQKTFFILLIRDSEYVDFGLEFLSRLSEVFKTRRVNIGDKFRTSGDHYTFNIEIWIRDVGIDLSTWEG